MKRLKGIHRDNDPIDQPQGTYRDALNAVLTKRKGAVASEEGTGGGLDISATYPGHTIIGDTSIFDGRHILFLADSSDGSGSSVIVTYKDGVITEVVSDSRLSFRNDSVLEAVSIINNRGQAVVYWTDNVNPPRFYNIDDADAATIEDVNSLRIFSTVAAAPRIEFNEIEESGGSVLTGTYYFGIRLIAEDDSKSSFMMFTPPIYVNDDTNVGNPAQYDGVEAGTTTSKKITLSIENLDQNFDRFEIAVIRKEDNTIAEVSLLPEQSIGGDSTSAQYTANEASTQSSIEEVLVNTASYQTAKSIAEIDNTLYMGNLSQKADLGYQRYANNITVEAIDKENNKGGAGIFSSDHFGNAQINFYDKSFKRGEVYALYIAFILDDGSESEAYHIPGRAPEGTELNDTGLSEFDAGTKEFQVESTPGTNNMAYWENTGEVYPNTDDWDIYDVDGSGNPVDTTNTLRGEAIRHHHFPDFANGYKHFQGLDTSNYSKSLGIRLSNVKIPESIIDRVRGVKVYYAKRTPSNRRIYDQGFIMPGTSVSIVGEPDPFWVNVRGINDLDTPFVTFNGFHSRRTRQNLGDVTHVKMIARAVGDAQNVTGTGDNDEIFYPLYDDLEDVVEADMFRKIKGGTAKAYLVPDAPNNTTNFGFSFDTFNEEGEESVAIEFDNSLNFQTNWGFDENASAGYIAELFSVKDILYSPFDLQELVWTGVIDTDVSKFDPREGGLTPDTAEGEIVVTGAADSETAIAAEGNIEVTGVTGTGQFEVQVDVDGDTATTTSDFTEASTTDQIATAIASLINNDPTISAGWTASIDPENSSNVLITSDNPGTADNGANMSALPVSESGDASATFDSNNASGGVDGEVDVTIAGTTITVPVADSATKATIATDITNAINADPTLSADYTATVDTGPADPVISIVADATGSEYNASITIDPKGTGATFTDTNITGGVSGGVAGASIIDEVYGADTFVNSYSFRRTSRDDTFGTIGGETQVYRHLVQSIVESYDNIKFRHEGEGVADIYHPKTAPENILRFEDNNPADGQYNNYIGYNIDYSALADVKVPAPNLLDDDNITRFPTRIIRSLQGDTNIGEDEGLRTFLENDFIDLTRTRGELTTLSVMDSILIPHMERAMIRTKGREEMLIGDIRAFVGAGDIFAVNPDEIISTKNGFAGLQDQRCAIVTPYGYFFVDRDAGKVFLVGDSPKVISDNGLNNYFSDKLDAITQEDQLICTWDNKWDRIILSYKGGGTPGDAWTISYYPEFEAWGSFHSYTPEYFFYDINTFYAKQGDAIYKHNVEGNPCGYYGTDYTLEFDFIENRLPSESKVFGNIQFITDVEGIILDEVSESDTWGSGFGNLGAFSISNGRVVYTNPGFYDHRAFVNKTLGSVSNFDMKAKFRPEGDADNNQDVFGLAARIQTSGEAGYVASYDLSSGSNDDRIKLKRFQDANTRTTLGSEIELGFNLDPNEEVWIRFQGIGDNFKVKAWKEGTPEPTSWHVEQTDSFIASGELGYFNHYGFTDWSATLFEYLLEDADSAESSVIFNESFDQYRVYNDLQDSGVKNAVYFTGAGGNARNVEGTWKINDFRNMLVGGVVDPNKAERLQDKIRGKWAGVRLIFNNTDNKSLYLYDTDMGVRRSHR